LCEDSKFDVKRPLETNTIGQNKITQLTFLQNPILKLDESNDKQQDIT